MQAFWAFDDNVLLFISCTEAEKNLHTPLNSQKLIDNLAIGEPINMPHWLLMESCRI